MRKVAFVFPGQGSQAIGMGQAFSEASDSIASIFKAFDAVVTPEAPYLSQIMFNGPEETLRQTLYTQPAIVAHSLAAYAAFKERCNISPVAVAGHSLGEYGALYAAGSLSQDEVITLIAKRGQLMAKAPSGAMSAVLGLDAQRIAEELESLTKTLSPVEFAVIANTNGPDQTVISGTPEAISQAGERLKAAGAKRVISLAVGGAFHSPLMEPANAEFAKTLAPIVFKNAIIPVISNIDARPEQDGESLKAKLSAQIPSQVRWTETMQALITEFEIDTLIEFGPGKVLGGIAKKMAPQLTLCSISDPNSLEETLAQIEKTVLCPA